MQSIVARRAAGERCMTTIPRVFLFGLLLLQISSGTTLAQSDRDAYPCQLALAGIKSEVGKAQVILEFSWASGAGDFMQEDMTVVVLFQPKPTARLKSELLA